MDSRKRDAVSIVTAVLVCVCSPTIAAPAKFKMQSVQLPAHFHKDIPYEGYKDPFYSDVIISMVGNKPCVKFQSYSPVTDHVSDFTVAAKFTDQRTLTFSFIDSWGTKGRGTIVLQSKAISISLVQVASSPSGLNAAESWPSRETLPRVKLDASLIPKKCCN